MYKCNVRVTALRMKNHNKWILTCAWEPGVQGVLQHPLEKIRGCVAPPAKFLLTIYKYSNCHTYPQKVSESHGTMVYGFGWYHGTGESGSLAPCFAPPPPLFS